MSTTLLTVLVLIPTAAVVVVIFAVMWRERASAREAWVACVSGAVLAAWAISAAMLARRGFFVQPVRTDAFPPLGITLAAAWAGLAASLTVSASLRRLLTNQRNLIRLNLWRYEGVVFLLLMAEGDMPAIWAVPAGIGDILVAVTAPWVAKHVDTPRGRRRAIIFNLLGMLDLIVAVALGMMTSPGPAHVLRTIPNSEPVTHFPLALVPAFLVPLAFTLHVVSLWQLLGGRWVSRREG